MTEYEIFKNQTLKLLGEIISYESAKPDDEADFDLIEDCEKMMCDLLEGSVTLSDEEIRIRIEKVKQKTQVSKPKKKIRRGFSRVAAALCAVLALCVSVCAVCVMNPEIREGIMKAMGISVGESVDVNGITFINNGAITEYVDMEKLLLDNDWDIMYPHDFPEKINIKSVNVMEQSNILLQIIFSDNSGNVTVYSSSEEKLDLFEGNNDTEKVIIRDNEFRTMQLDDRWIAILTDDRYTYYISYMDKAGLYTIMGGFGK